MAKNKIFKNRQGSALVFVLLILLITMIISTSVVFMFSTNHKQALQQERNIREHYLAVSAIDVTIATLLSPLDESNELSMKDKIVNDDKDIIIGDLSDEIEIDGKKIEIDVLYDKNDKDITIKANVMSDKGSTKELNATLQFTKDRYKIRWD